MNGMLLRTLMAALLLHFTLTLCSVRTTYCIAVAHLAICDLLLRQSVVMHHRSVHSCSVVSCRGLSATALCDTLFAGAPAATGAL
jgi:hypothetical protein